MELWQWAVALVVAAVVWPIVVFYTALMWGAGIAAGEIRYIESLNATRKGGKDDDVKGT